MKLAIVGEIAPGERRVAGVPLTIRQFLRAGLGVLVDAGAGAAALFDDEAYRQAGAEVVQGAPAAWGQADIVVKVRPPMGRPDGVHEARQMRPGSVLVCLLYPARHAEALGQLTEAGITAFALDLLPRTTAAQPMDALSSQATVAGYEAVVLASATLPKLFPLLMTAAGTVRPARVLVIGAGVAGLQAIATARRLGAIVTGIDTRPEVGEQIRSLGARFVPLETGGEAQTAGGYAADLGEAFYRAEQETVAPYAAESDVIITTAQIPDRPAPILLPEATLARMKRGSVIVDLAIETGGNCPASRADQRVESHGVTVLAPLDLPSRADHHASQLYASNVAAFVGALLLDGQLNIDMSNPVIRETLVTGGPPR